MRWHRSCNEFGGNKNLQAVEFFKHLNSVVLGRNPGAVMIAEESTAWPKVTGEVEDDGLGFSLKWNMGWMHDFTEYMKLDPLFRKGAHYNMTFAMSYAYSEKYILVLSHDEVVHLKCSMINKMPGLGWEKFENLKAAYAFMMGHSGKKLLFMILHSSESGVRSGNLIGICWLRKSISRCRTGYVICFICTAAERHSMSRITPGKDSNGSMRMTETEAFTALYAMQKAASRICSL